VADALDLPGEQVDGLGGPVGAAAGGVEGEELGLPRPDRAGKPGQLRDLDAICPAVEALQGSAGRLRADHGVDGSEQLLALPGRGDLAGRIPGGQPSPQPPLVPAG